MNSTARGRGARRLGLPARPGLSLRARGPRPRHLVHGRGRAGSAGGQQAGADELGGPDSNGGGGPDEAARRQRARQAGIAVGRRCHACAPPLRAPVFALRSQSRARGAETAGLGRGQPEKDAVPCGCIRCVGSR